MDLNIPSIDIENVDQGIWKEYPWDKNIKVRIAMASNPKARALLKRLTKEGRDQYGNNVPDSFWEELNYRVYAGAVITDWCGITSKGKNVPYTAESAYEIISDRKYKNFFDFIFGVSEQIANYRQEVIAEDEKKP